MTKLRFLLLLLVCYSMLPLSSQGRVANFSKVGDGVIIRFNPNGLPTTRLLKLQVITESIIHVMASPVDSFSTAKSLMLTGDKMPSVKWDLQEAGDKITLSTSRVNAIVNTNTGAISFTDKNGHVLVSEKKEGGRVFDPIVLNGDQYYALNQAFQSDEKEAFYGLGQHQEGVMNYKNTQVNLLNYNTDIAIPFLVSNRHYGILWDNYSITRVMDSRDFEPLSTMQLFSATGEQGWLTASYINRDPARGIITRPESEINYSFIPNLKTLPDSVLLKDVTVKWEGSIATGFTGEHSFYMRAAGYTRIWVDGKMMADKWRQAWNPGTVLFKVPMVKGKKYAFRIEWDPDGGESYIGCSWLKPLEGEAVNEYSFRSEAGRQVDYYLIGGDNMDDIIGGYRLLTGKATIMPKWALGFWQSRERYKTQDEILSTVAEFRKRKIPLDNIVEDWSYWKVDQWGSQEFDEKRFPDPAGMIKTLHDTYHTQFMISVWPKFYVNTDNYKLFDRNGWMLTRNAVQKNRDWIGKGYLSGFYDAFNPAARDAFWTMMNKHLYQKGVDAWWLDATEPDVHSNLNVQQRKELMNPTAIGPSTVFFNGFPLQNAKGVYEGQRKENPNKRVFILTRSAYAGLQRYAAANWSGDIGSRWEDFKNQIPAGLNYSLSGLPYWTTDIGGFSVEKRYENATGEELEEWREQMTRWYQYGAFCPIFRVHGQFPFREIYNTAPEDHPAYKSMLYYDQLRYRLMPYIYSLAQKTYHENYTMMRGLPMDFASDEKVTNIGDQFMFGPAILVNPVYEFKSRSRELYLPAGSGWYEFYSGNFQEGGRSIKADAPYERIPLFIKQGSIVPVGPALQYVAEKPADPITLFVYTGKDASFTLFEDEGTNYDYEKGLFSRIVFRYAEATGSLTVSERSGNFPGMMANRTFNIVWVSKNKPVPLNPDAPPDTVLKYTGQKLVTIMKK